MTPLDRMRHEPYRLLFPLGAACAALGLAMWVAFWLRPEIGYPGPAHALIMMHGFIGSFIIGFLMTMLPRAIGVPICGTWHLVIATAGITGGCAAAYANAPNFAWGAHLLALAAPVGFIAGRARLRASAPPSSFACAAAGVFAAICGSAMAIAGGLGAPAWVGALGRGLDHQAFPLLMILGIGSFLIPKLAGPAGARISPQGVWFNVALALIMLASFALEFLPCEHDAAVRLRVAYAMRAAVFAHFVIKNVLPARLHVDAPSYLKSIPIALSAMAIGLALPAVWPAYTLAWLHLVYVAGELWLTLIIASRVLIGHAPDRGTPRAGIVLGYGVLLAAATISRVITGIWPGQTYVLHLAVSALLALGGLAVWSLILIPRFWSFPASRGH
jgi:uncharacterized protein involved in response to NO